MNVQNRQKKFTGRLIILSAAAFLLLYYFTSVAWLIPVFFFLLTMRLISEGPKNNRVPRWLYIPVAVLDLYAGWRFVHILSYSSRIRAVASAIHLPVGLIPGAVAAGLALLAMPFMVSSLHITLSNIRHLPAYIRGIGESFEWKQAGLLAYPAFAALCIIVIAMKQDYFVDEVFTYGLSNSSYAEYAIHIEEEKQYTPAEKVFLDYMTVSHGHRFDYKNVWIKQALDVHPPLYYALVHTVCSLFPGTYSRWMAGSVNIVFALLTLFLMRRMIRMLLQDGRAVTLASLLFILSPGVLNTVACLRMYAMASFWALALVQIITKDLLRGSEKTTLVKIFWVAVAGALTHYYCIVFTVLLCAGYTLIRAIMRQWKPVLGMCVTGGCAALTAYTVFPAMLYHMFGGYRGTESMDNLRAPFGELLIRIRQYVRLLCSQILGGSVLATVILLILIGYVLYCLFRKREKLRSFRALALILCGITAFLFFLFVARSAVYITDRYVMLVYPEILLTVSAVLFLAEKELLHLPHGGGYAVSVGLLATVFVITAASYRHATWPYHGFSREDFLSKTAEYTGTDCLYVYKEAWRVSYTLTEVSHYRSVTFVRPERLEIYMDSAEQQKNLHAEKDQLIVIISEETLLSPEAMMAMLDTYTSIEEIGPNGAGVTYRISR